MTEVPLPAPPPPSKALCAFIDDWDRQRQAALFPVQQASGAPSPAASIQRPRVAAPFPFLCGAISAAQYQPPPQQQGTDCSNMMLETGIVSNEEMLLHRNESAFEVERPERVSRTIDHLKATGLWSLCKALPCPPATLKQLRRVHAPDHIDRVDQWGFAVSLGDSQAVTVSSDLYVAKETPMAARLAAGGVVSAALAVARGEVQNAFALVRPPGHHCTSSRPSGFCFFNNVAVAVRAAQDQLQQNGVVAPKILVVDWDVHHGEGTEQVFYDDPSVVVFSIHQHGSLPQHTLRRPKQSTAKRPRSPSASDEVPPITTDVDMDELAQLLDSDDSSKASTSSQEEDEAAVNEDLITTMHNASTPPPQQDEEEGSSSSSSSSGRGPSRLRRRPPPVVDFKALNEQLTDLKKDPFLAVLADNRLQDKEEGNPSGMDNDEGYATSTSDDRDSDESTTEDTTTTEEGVPRRRLRAGDTDGESDDEHLQVHQHGIFYPGTGHAHRVGGAEWADEDGDEGDGDSDTTDHKEETPSATNGSQSHHHPAAGRQINFPWPTTGFGDIEYWIAMEEIVVPVALEFQPDMIFISCGFDCADQDLLGSMRVTPTGFHLMTKLMTRLCPKVVVALEGGYNLKQVALGSEGVLRALLTASGARGLSQLVPSTSLHDRLRQTIDLVKSTQQPYWKCFQSQN